MELQPLPPIAFSNLPGTKPSFELCNRPSTNRETQPRPNVPQGSSVITTSGGRPQSKYRFALTILQLSSINFFGSFTTGIITVGLPIIAQSISLQRSLYLWPSSVYSLTSGAALLIAGSVADIVGARKIDFFGISLIGIFILACGFSQTGVQLVVFRAFQGVALAMHIPASVSIIAGAAPAGRARNIGFGFLGLSQPLGFSFGMVISGFMIDKIGWRSGFYLSGAAILTVAAVSWFTVSSWENEATRSTTTGLLERLFREIDWVGGLLAGGGLALLSYVLARVN